MLALYGGGRYGLSQKYNNWYAPIWNSWTPERRERQKIDFRAAAPTLEETFIKPVNAGWRPSHQLRMQQQSEQSVIFDCVISGPTTLPTLVAPVANLSPSRSVLVPGSAETATVNLNSPVTFTLSSSQTSTSQRIYFEEPHQCQETIFELHLKIKLNLP